MCSNARGTTEAIGQDDVERELRRLNQSFEETLAELEQSSQRIEFEFDAALAGIFRAHGAMLRDLFASGEFERELRTSLLTAETAVRRVFHRWYQKFEALENQTLRQRADDVLDLGRNIIRRLRASRTPAFNQFPSTVFWSSSGCCRRTLCGCRSRNVMAVVVESLGQGSHAALLAREKGIPTITEIPGILAQVANGTELLVDGFRGTPGDRAAAATRARILRAAGKVAGHARALQGSLQRAGSFARRPADSSRSQYRHRG